MFLKTANGFWIVKNLVSDQLYRTHNFWTPKVKYPAGSKISVSAFTRSGKNTTRIPFVINFYIENEEDIKDEEMIIRILGQMFNHRTVLMIESYRDKIINHTYIYDDERICNGLHIDHDLYLKQHRQFLRLIRIFIYSYNVRRFKLYRSNEWVALTDKIGYKYIKKPDVRININFFYDMIESISSEFNITCQYIENGLNDAFLRDSVNMLSILRIFSTKIESMSLYYMYYNLYLKNKDITYRKLKLDNDIQKIQKWSCDKDCAYRCGIKSPLHLLANKYKLDSDNYQENFKSEHGLISRDEIFTSILLAFFGGAILNKKKIFISGKRIHLGILSFILRSDKVKEHSAEEQYMTLLKQDYSNIIGDIKLSTILKLRENEDSYNILSDNPNSTFLKSLHSRSPNYEERILALRDAIPFISSTYRKQGKINILQFINFEELTKIFTYKPLKEIGFLGRAIVCEEGNPNNTEIFAALHKIHKFSQNSDTIIKINLDIDRINNSLRYKFNKDETLFTKNVMSKFYVSIASILSILLGISEEKIEKISDYFIINDSIISDACICANNILNQRDWLLFPFTKKYEVENKLVDLLNNKGQEYLYHRDIYRKFSREQKKILDNFIIQAMMEGNIERWIVGDKQKKNTPIIYRYEKRYSLLKKFEI